MEPELLPSADLISMWLGNPRKHAPPIIELQRTDLILFVGCDSAGLIANARLETLFWNRLGRTGLRELVINRDDASLPRVLDGVVCSFSYRVILERQGTDINVQ